MTTITNTILACVDGSIYTDSVCDHAAWASQRLNAPVHLLHLQSPDAVRNDDPTERDLSGTLSLGVKSALLEKLTRMDEERGKIDQQQGKLILEHAKERLAESEIVDVDTFHRRGALVEAISELDDRAQLIILGKRGEHADFAKLHLGSNLERVVRAAQKPVLVAARAFNSIDRFVIAYDGGPSTRKALDYVASSPLLKGLACHLLRIGPDDDGNRRSLQQAAVKLTESGFVVETRIEQGDADEVLATYVKTHEMSLLVMGAYGHSHIRTLIIGSTTSNMLRSCPIPVLMFR